MNEAQENVFTLMYSIIVFRVYIAIDVMIEGEVKSGVVLR